LPASQAAYAKLIQDGQAAGIVGPGGAAQSTSAASAVSSASGASTSRLLSVLA
jgi:hypothetical protein